MELDVQITLSCAQLASTLADAYTNPSRFSLYSVLTPWLNSNSWAELRLFIHEYVREVMLTTTVAIAYMHIMVASVLTSGPGGWSFDHDKNYPPDTVIKLSFTPEILWARSWTYRLQPKCCEYLNLSDELASPYQCIQHINWHHSSCYPATK